MLNKTYALGLLSVAALGVLSLPVRAEQTSIQVTNQSSAAVGDFNQILQQSNQITTQQQINKYGRPGQIRVETQDSIQDATQTAGAVGHGNQIQQATEQITIQQKKTKLRRPVFHR